MLSVRHDIITSVLLDARSVILDLSTVCAVAQQPMQEHALAYASRVPPACLLQVQVSKSGALLQARSRHIRLASARPREATTVSVISVHSDHHHRVACGALQANAPLLSSMCADLYGSKGSARAHSMTRSTDAP